MARPRIIPDEAVYEAVHHLTEAGGLKAVTFAAVGKVTGLAPSSLADRHGSVQAMILDARADAWRQLEQATEAALATAPLSQKGAIAVLKALPDPNRVDIDGFPDRALRWRQMVEGSLAIRLGGGERARVAAAVLFAYWLGQARWGSTGKKSVRMKDVLRALI